jgi:carbonic anhydrase
MKLTTLTKVLSLLLALNLNLSASEASHKIHWSYNGETSPAYWGEITPKFHTCGEGLNQSPIDLKGFIDGNLSTIPFDYNSTSTEIVNNGHSIQVNVAEGSTIKVDGIIFELKQFHFHTPSENNINGKSFPLEAHFVHSSKEGELAVVALMFNEGKKNKVLEQYWLKMPMKAGEKSELIVKTIETLLPKNRDYYRFNGSLTTPPCTEGVRWIVLKDATTLSKAQIKKFAKVMEHPNNRPIQAINARVIIE